MTKAELVARVAALEAEVERLLPDGKVQAHLALLESALAPYLRRLERLPAAELALEEAEGIEEVKVAAMRLGVVQLDAREVGAMNNLLRQIAEVKGLLLSRRKATEKPERVEEAGCASPSPEGRKVPLGKIANIVRLGGRRGA